MGELGSGAGSSYPTALDTDDSLESTLTLARKNVPNDLAAAIIAVETEMGLDPAGSYDDVVSRLNAIDTNYIGTLKVADIITKSPWVDVRAFGAKGDGVTDDTVAWQAAIDAANANGGGIIKAKGGATYSILGELVPKSNVIIDGEKTLTFTKPVAATTDRVFSSSGASLLNFWVVRCKFTTSRTAAAGAQAAININNVTTLNYIGFEENEYDCIKGSNFVFVAVIAGGTATNIYLRKNIIKNCQRMAFEITNHLNDVAVAAWNVRVENNRIENCATIGISFSGPMEVCFADNNYLKNCDVGIEGVNAATISINNNIFEGTFTSLISTSVGSLAVTSRNLVISHNKTVGAVTGRIFISNAQEPIIVNNNWNISNCLTLSGLTTTKALVKNNKIITQDVYVIIADNSPDHIIEGNYLSNVGVTNWSVVRAYNVGTTGIFLKNNMLYKGTGGVYFDSADGAGDITLLFNYLDGAAIGVEGVSTAQWGYLGAATQGIWVTTHKARAYHGGTAQVIATATLTVVELETESYDPGAAFDVANYYYVVQKTGYYHIDAALEFNVGVVDAKLVNLQILQGATAIIDNVFNSSGTTEISAVANDTVYLTLNDQISMKIWHNFGGNATLRNTASRTFMAIHFISE